ncbi:hypothetical protein FACS189426_13470 [Bacteroidia bacterium]|nr:hypothetical protein FACS189426_13470 [Bacteroidia bacterium]GHU64590.1 hypothetical protein FACS1894123_09510 [Bacteroidia bacterium]GHV72142.1 hypothetical protein FACS189420_8770 [Bacteroidia bacterium]
MAKLFFSNRTQKGVIDILLILVLICIPFTLDDEYKTVHSWGLHCIVGIIWFLLMLIHSYQHWPLIKAFTKKKVILKNKITALTIFTFIFMIVSIVWFIFGINDASISFHRIGHIFPVIVIIHVIQKWKRLVSLFQNKR